MPENWQENGFGVYVHWPFCQAKCPYCDFNSHVSQKIDHKEWADAFSREIGRRAEFTNGRVISSVFFGGGTPSLMQPSTVETVLTELQRHHTFANDVEITLEGNPTSIEANTFKDFASAGINRVSLGIQALNDTDLKRLGRLHSAKEALKALELAQNVFSRVSFDLIYARQHQGLKDWLAELERALALGTEHLSLYQLTIEQGTAFGDRFAKGMLGGLPTDDLSVEMYEATYEACESAGMHRYEVSNHAQIGAESRHNQIYWRGGDYLGIGPGAHGRLSRGDSRYATLDPRFPRDWLSASMNNSATTMESLSMDHWSEEALIMGLRLETAFDLDAWCKRFNRSVPNDAIQDLEDLQFVELKSGKMKVTKAGRLLLNSITEKILST